MLKLFTFLSVIFLMTIPFITSFLPTKGTPSSPSEGAKVSLVQLVKSKIEIPPSLQSSVNEVKVSAAMRNYDRRPKTELSKLIYLMDVYRNTGYLVIHDSVEYEPQVALRKAKDYIQRNYRKQAAERWVKEHAYRSKSSGEIIYLKSPKGEIEPLRDALLRQLQGLAK